MFKARYFKADGKKGRARPLPPALFDGVVNEGVLHQVIKAHLANQRQGTGSAKNRAAVRGGSRKPWRQKGTGRARQGTIRAAQWEGGGRAFPPIPHSWRQRIPRKVKALARRSAYNARAEEDRVVLVDLPALETPRTRDVKTLLKALELDGSHVLVLTHGLKRTFFLSARNLPNVEVRPFGEESPYDLLRAEVVLIERAAIDDFAKSSEEAEAKRDVAEPVSEGVPEDAPDEKVTDEDGNDA
jgi:large subunit ribosomal protein L4